MVKFQLSEFLATLILLCAITVLYQYESFAHYSYLDGLETVKWQSLYRDDCKTMKLSNTEPLSDTLLLHDSHIEKDVIIKKKDQEIEALRLHLDALTLQAKAKKHKEEGEIGIVRESDLIPKQFQEFLEAFHPSIIRDFGPWLSRKIDRPTSPRCQLIIIRNSSEISYLNSEALPEALYNKARALDTQIRWVTRRLHFSGKVTSMCFHLGSTPVHSTKDHFAHPTYSLAKSDDHLDILYPNMYFGFGGSLDEWDDFQTKLAAKAAEHPYKTREDRGFWRGTCGAYKYNQPRINLVLAGKENSTMLDVGFSNKCPLDEGESTDPEEQSLRVEEVNALPPTKFIRPLEMTKYKYLFNMPGSSKGSYSRHMQTALCSNATVFLWDNKYYEFYYSLLKPWIHYLPVSEKTLDERLAWVRDHQPEAEQIASNGFEFCMTHLRSSAFPVYWFQLFTMHDLLQAYEVEVKVSQAACTCGGRSGQAICNFC
jgi:hypothetical protein